MVNKNWNKCERCGYYRFQHDWLSNSHKFTCNNFKKQKEECKGKEDETPSNTHTTAEGRLSGNGRSQSEKAEQVTQHSDYSASCQDETPSLKENEVLE